MPGNRCLDLNATQCMTEVRDQVVIRTVEHRQRDERAGAGQPRDCRQLADVPLTPWTPTLAHDQNIRSGPDSRYKPLRRVAQPLRLGQRLELLEGVVLDLPDPLAGDVERPPDLLERVRPLAREPESHLDH